ncbi:MULTISPECIES: hypothetical protein [unclassified Luteococcus]|uniref:hypothetical protein n=1 Tax=unclassified Luteococcus TaxID=2639923 RepID=UPI00313A8174
MKDAEKQLCRQIIKLCLTWAEITYNAEFIFQNTPRSKSIVAAGKPPAPRSNDRDDRRQALRHQYWSAWLYLSLKNPDAWLQAHESGEKNKEDVRCDMRNNLTGKQIATTGIKRYPNVSRIGELITYIDETIYSGVKAGKYCARRR